MLVLAPMQEPCLRGNVIMLMLEMYGVNEAGEVKGDSAKRVPNLTRRNEQGQHDQRQLLNH